MLWKFPNQKLLQSSGHFLRQLKRSRLTRCVAVQHSQMHHEHPPTCNGQNGAGLIQNYARNNYNGGNNEKFKYKKQVSTLVGLVGTAVLLSGGAVLSEAQEEDLPDPDSADTLSKDHVDHSLWAGRDVVSTERPVKKIKVTFIDTENPKVRNGRKLHLTSLKDHHDGRNCHHSDPSTCLKKFEAERLARKLLKQRMQEVGAPGMVVAVTVNGKTVWTEGLGYADLENNVRCSPDTVMRVASISKSITMTAAAQLWEAGKLDLDAPIQTYIPSFPHKTYEGEEVTITTRQLISHKAGIRHYELKDPNKKKKGDTKSTEETKEEDKVMNEGKQESEFTFNKSKANAKSTEETKEGDTECPSDKKNDAVAAKASSLADSKAEKDDKTGGGKNEKEKQNIAEERRKQINRIINSKANQKKKKKKKKEKDEDNEFDLEEYYIKEEFGSVKEALELFQDDELFFKPGCGYLYTTHGWTLVSAVVEAAAGKPFTQVARQLFRELGLDNTYLDQHDPIIYNRARYYVRNKRGKLLNAPYVDNSYKWAGGGFLSTVSDLCKFGNAMLYASQYTGGDGLPGYLKASTIKELWQQVEGTEKEWRVDGGYGMGWEVCDGGAKKGFCRSPKYYAGHSGAAVGASSFLLILPKNDSEECSASKEINEKKGIKVTEGKNNTRNIGNVGSSGKRSETYEVKKGPQVPEGVVVALITNMQGVGLRRIALEIGELFEKAYLCREE